MPIATIDCGTTYSRVYIVDQAARVLGKARVKAGVRDTAITGSRDTLKEGIRTCFQAALDDAGTEVERIDLVLAAGMITAEIGLLEIPHLWAPAGVEDLAANLVDVHDTDVFPPNVPVYFVPGIKNRFDPATVSPEQVGLLDFMRGEEVQIIGLLASGAVSPPAVAAVLSSHTKFIPVGSDGRIEGSVTTLSGQVYEAVQAETFIGKSTRPGDGEDERRGDDYWDDAVVANARHWVERTGISRTFLMTRFLDVLLHRPWYERRLFVESAIAAEDLNALGQVKEMVGPDAYGHLLLIGSPRRTRIYQTLLGAASAGMRVSAVTDADQIDSLSIRGVLAVAARAGLLDERKSE